MRRLRWTLFCLAASVLLEVASKADAGTETPFVVTKALDALSIDISPGDISEAEAEKLTLQRRMQIEWVRLVASWKMVYSAWLWTTTIFWEKMLDVEQHMCTQQGEIERVRGARLSARHQVVAHPIVKLLE